MKSLLIVLSLVLASTAAHAQVCTVAEAASHPSGCTAIIASLSPESRMAEAKRFDDERRSAATLRNVGIATTLIGAALTIAGSVQLVKGFCLDSCEDSSDNTFTGGAVMLGIGQAAAVAGTIMWVNGGVRAARAERAQITASAGGLKLTF